MRVVLLSLLAGSIIAACSEATDGWIPYALEPVVAADGGAPEDDASSTTPTPTFDAKTTSSSVVLLNEVSASKEWIEIVNSGTAEVDLGGYKIADRDKNTGEPKLEEAASLRQGTLLGPKEYGMVVGGGADSGKSCPGDPKFCLNAEFGISAKNGETIFLVAPDGGVVGTVVVPATDAGDGITWGRIPNGDPKGEFKETPATPAAPN